MRRGLVAAAALLVLAAVGASWWTSRKAPRPNVLLISIDTLRADRLGCYGYAPAETPIIDALAARGLRFTNATTVAPLTLPAHTSLLTGTFPALHGVRDNGQFYVEDELVTLAEVLKANGYRTGGFVGAFVLDRRWGIAQGFDMYFDEFDLSKYPLAAGIDAAQRPGNEVVDRATAWLSKRSDGPFFAWVHLYDPHAPYAAPAAIAERFPQTQHGAYDAEVAFTDTQVGRLLNALGDERDNTLIVVVADHGESLGEHQEQQHGFFIYEAATHIPLIVAGPGIQAHVATQQVRIVDVMPTVLDALRLTTPPAVQGVTLLPSSRGERQPLVALSETWYPRYHYGWSELVSVRDGRYKFIAAPRRELYDLRDDPAEQHDLAATDVKRADAMERVLRNMQTAMAGRRPQLPREVDPDVEERLRTLGYVGSSVSSRALEERPRSDPKDKIALYNLLKQAGSDSVAGHLDDAIAKVRRVLSEDPEVIEAYLILGNLHTKRGKPAEAISAYRQALALDDTHENAAFALALAYKQANELDAAEAGLKRVLQINPRSTKAQWQLADISMRRGEFARAEQTLKTALAAHVDRPALLLKLGEAQLQLGKHDEAERNLRESLRLKPDQAMALYDLGVLYEARGDLARAVESYEAELKAHPRVYQAQFNLGKIFSKLGRPKDAAEHFRAAVDANPAFGTGYLYLAKALLDSGNLRESEAAALTGLGSDAEPTMKPLGHYVLADVYSRLGREREAARHVALGRRLERGGN